MRIVNAENQVLSDAPLLVVMLLVLEIGNTTKVMVVIARCHRPPLAFTSTLAGFAFRITMHLAPPELPQEISSHKPTQPHKGNDTTFSS